MIWYWDKNSCIGPLRSLCVLSSGLLVTYSTFFCHIELDKEVLLGYTVWIIMRAATLRGIHDPYTPLYMGYLVTVTTCRSLFIMWQYINTHNTWTTRKEKQNKCVPLFSIWGPSLITVPATPLQCLNYHGNRHAYKREGLRMSITDPSIHKAQLNHTSTTFSMLSFWKVCIKYWDILYCHITTVYSDNVKYYSPTFSF
jgi:hypothetical protein